MILKLLCISLIGVAIAQSPVRNVFPEFEDDDEAIKASSARNIFPEFENDDSTTERTSATIVIPEFEDDDVNSNNEGVNEEDIDANKDVFGGQSTTENPFEFHIIYQTPATNEGQQVGGNEDLSGNGIVDFVPENTDDLPAEVATVASVATQATTQNPGGLNGLFHIVGNAVHEVVNENANDFNKGVDSILGVGQSILHATNNIVENKKKAVVSIPRFGFKLFQALERQ